MLINLNESEICQVREMISVSDFIISPVLTKNGSHLLYYCPSEGIVVMNTHTREKIFKNDKIVGVKKIRWCENFVKRCKFPQFMLIFDDHFVVFDGDNQLMSHTISPSDKTEIIFSPDYKYFTVWSEYKWILYDSLTGKIISKYESSGHICILNCILTNHYFICLTRYEPVLTRIISVQKINLWNNETRVAQLTVETQTRQTKCFGKLISPNYILLYKSVKTFHLVDLVKFEEVVISNLSVYYDFFLYENQLAVFVNKNNYLFTQFVPSRGFTEILKLHLKDKVKIGFRNAMDVNQVITSDYDNKICSKSTNILIKRACVDVYTTKLLMERTPLSLDIVNNILIKFLHCKLCTNI